MIDTMACIRDNYYVLVHETIYGIRKRYRIYLALKSNIDTKNRQKNRNEIYTFSKSSFFGIYVKIPRCTLSKTNREGP